MALKLLIASCAIASRLVAAESITSTTVAGSTIVVTATTGTPPPTVTYTAVRDTSLASLTITTTSSGTIFFPFGWYWAPVVPPVGLPSVLPTIPSGLVPPEANVSPTLNPSSNQECTSTTSPTVSLIVSYSEDPSGAVQTTTVTRRPSGLGSTCIAQEATMTTTLSYTADFFLGGPVAPGNPRPTIYPAVNPGTLQYIIEMLNKDGFSMQENVQPVQCSDTTYDKAVPSAVAFIKGLSPYFCGDWVSKSSSKFEKSYTARDVKTDKLRRTIQGRTPPPQKLTPESYVNWKVDFSWEPDVKKPECQKQEYCDKQLSTMLTRCQGFTMADAYRGGSIEDECGIFTYTVHNPPPPKARDATTCDLTSWDNVGVRVVTADDNFIGSTPRENGVFGTAFHNWPTHTFQAAADNFCRRGKSFKYERNAKPYPVDSSQWYWINSDQQDSTTSQSSVCFDTRIDLWESQFLSNSDMKCSGNGSGKFKSNSKVLLSVIPSPNQSGCSAWKGDVYNIPSGDDCYSNFEQVFQNCASKDGQGRMGVYKANTQDSGCWDYWMIGVALD